MVRLGLFFGFVALSFLLIAPSTVQAHFTVGNETSKLGLVLHVDPYHYPVAGKTNKLTFFLNEQQEELPEEDFSIVLAVTDEAGVTAESEGTLGQDGIVVEHYFDALAAYDITLTLDSNDSDAYYIFSSSLETVPESERRMAVQRRQNTQRLVGGSFLVFALSVLGYSVYSKK